MGEMKDVVVPEKFKALVESIEKMTVLDLAELVKLLEDKFGVSAAAPMMMGGMMPAAGAAGPAASEKTEFTVELTEAGANKIALIKAIRTATNMSLKEAKDITDAAPKVVKENMKKDEAEALKTALEAAGGKVTLK